MAFKSAAQATFTAPCIAYLPRDDGKQFQHRFRVRFKKLNKAEMRELTGERDGSHTPAEDGERDFVDRVLDRVLVGFVDGLTDESEKPLEFTPENVAEVLNEVQYRSAMFRSFFEHHDKAPGKP